MLEGEISDGADFPKLGTIAFRANPNLQLQAMQPKDQTLGVREGHVGGSRSVALAATSSDSQTLPQCLELHPEPGGLLSAWGVEGLRPVGLRG